MRIIDFGHAIDSKTIKLTDISDIKSSGCLKNNINLALFRILATGKSWYESEPYNFRSDDMNEETLSHRNADIRNMLFDEYIPDLLEEFHNAFPEIHTEGKMVKEVFTEILNKRDTFTEEQCEVTTKLSKYLEPRVTYSSKLELHLTPENKYSKKGGNKKTKRRRRNKKKRKTNRRRKRL